MFNFNKLNVVVGIEYKCQKKDFTIKQNADGYYYGMTTDSVKN